MQNLDEAIRQRAYHLWIADGQPDGQADLYWLSAQREVLTTSLESSATTLPWLHRGFGIGYGQARQKAKVARSGKSKARAA